MLLSLILYILTTFLIGSFGCFLSFLVYLYYLHRINDHLPGPPRSSFILGHLPDIWKYKVATGKLMFGYMLEKRCEYGPIFLVFFAHRPMMFLANSSYMRHVFINNHKSLSKSAFLFHKIGFIFGERGAGYGLVSNADESSWRNYHRKCLRDFMSNFNNVCDRFLDHMDTVVDSGKPTSMVQEFGKATLETISQVSFNINTNAIEDPGSKFIMAMQNCLRGVQANFDIPLSPTLLAIFQFKLFQNTAKKEQIEAARFLRKFASDCITARMKDIADANAVPDDLLSVLIRDGSLSMDDIIDEFLTIFVAGQETTANTLSFTLFEIIRNPHVEVKLLNEVKEVLLGREHIEFGDLAKLQYLGQVLEESLRKHPVVAAPVRVLVQDITIGGYHIPKGDGIHGLQMFFSMNPDIWSDPEVFDPDRFSNVENIPNFSTTHFPFSIGPHTCIGQNFAKFESKVILAKLLQKFRFKLLPGQTDSVDARLTLTPRDGVMCEVTRREF